MGPLLIILSWQFVLFGLTITSAMSVVRIVVDYLLELNNKDPSKSQLWNEVVLPLLPLFLGGIGAVLFKSFSYPDVLVSNDDRIVFGVVAGLLSGLIYRVVKSVLYQRLTDTVADLHKVSNDQVPSRGQL